MSKMDHSVPADIVATHANCAFGSGLAANRNEQKVNDAGMTT
jgi:hypothetical protein